MPLFMSKEDILGTATTAVKPSSASGIGLDAMNFDGDTLSKFERILSQVNGVLTQANILRGNIKPAEGAQAPNIAAQLNAVESRPAPIVQQLPAPAPAPVEEKKVIEIKIKKEFNEDEVRLFLDHLFEELEKAPEGMKGQTMGALIGQYKLVRGAVQEKVIGELKASADKLIR